MNVRVVEEVTVFTPLGLRFWDPVLNRPIVDGLKVGVWPMRGPRRVTPALLTRSGVYTFRWLPGMRPVEHRYPDPDFFDASVPQRRSFVVGVTDEQDRFLPVAFEVALPLPYRGVFLNAAGISPPDGVLPGVPLFSAPTRRAGDTLVGLRGTLVDADTGRPAPWALLSVTAPHGRRFYGVADAEGRFAVLFPFPSLAEGFAGSPASFGHGTPVGARGWDLTVTVSYEPGRLRLLPGTPVPEYRTIAEQARAGFFGRPPNPSDAAETELSLRLDYGRERVLRTDGLTVQLVSAGLASP